VTARAAMKAVAALIICITLGIAGGIVAGVSGVALLTAGAVASKRRSRRRESVERWRIAATDAYVQARLIDDLTFRKPAASPDLRRRIVDARIAFHALASSGPDPPSTQAASMVYSALDDLRLALTAPSADDSTSTSRMTRDRLDYALARLRPLVGLIAPVAEPTREQRPAGGRTRGTDPVQALRPGQQPRPWRPQPAVGRRRGGRRAA
jgi:hypothetical protein